MEPDERVRSRIREVAGEGAAELDDDARRRIVRAVGASGPKLVARGRAERLAVRGAVTLCAAAAAVWLLAWAREDRAEPIARRTMPAPELAVEACVTRSVPEGARFLPVPGGGSQLDLDTRAFVTAAEGTAVRLERIESCVLELGVEHGSVSVHARDLGGGELAVRTPDAEIAVRGTRFTVTRDESGTTVAVEEGVVAVRIEGDERARVRAGETARVVSGTVEVAATDTPPASVPETEPVMPDEGAGQPARESAEALVARAARLARDGELDGARRLYARAATMRGPTAEAACLSLAKLELDAGRLEPAREALVLHGRRFARGALAVEAAWIAVRIERRAGRDAEAHRIAREVAERYPGTPQAEAAGRLLLHPTGGR